METTVKGFNLKTIEAGSVGGAKLSVSGNVLNTEEGPDGTIGISVAAEDPRGLLRLTGLLPRDTTPQWSSVLGKTALKIDLQAKPSATVPTTHFGVIGKVGDLDITSNGSFTVGSSTGLKGTTEIKSPSSATLFNLFGGAVETADAIPARAVLTADGVLHDSFQIDLQSEIYRSNVKFRGNVNPDPGKLVLDGNLTVQSAQAQDLLAALKIPALSAVGGQLSFATKINTAGNVQSFDEIEAKLSDFTLTGSAALKDQTQLTGDFDVGDISLVNTMAPVFLPWNGSAQPLEETFARTLPFGLTGVVWVRPKTLEIYPGLAVGNAQIGITAAAVLTEFIASAKTEEGDDIAVEIASRPATEGRKITGRVTVPIDVFQRFKLSDGRSIAAGLATVDVKFEGVGRSPGGVLAMLNGKGAFELQDGKLLNLTPENFSKLILTAKDAESLELAFAGLRSGAGITLGPVSGPVTIANGVATFTPFGMTGPDAQVLVKPIAELADGKFDLGVVLSLKALPELPPMEISYSGTPSRLVAGEDRTALTSYLGFKVLEQGVDALEKVQKEQERMAIEEEKLRKLDEERLTAFYAQRAELRLRQRELKVHAAQRILDVELAKAEEQRLIREGDAINKAELRLRQRELRVHRKVLAEAAPREKPVTAQPAVQIPQMPASPSDLY
jgi:hypothetical protein